MKSIIDKADVILSGVLAVVGIGVIVLAFFNTPLELQIGMGLVGLGFIALGLFLLRRTHDRKLEEERFDRVIARLDEIQEELQKEEKPRGGVAIADIINSGLKYYTEHMSGREKDDK
jgi:hypothetical protein